MHKEGTALTDKKLGNNFAFKFYLNIPRSPYLFRFLWGNSKNKKYVYTVLSVGLTTTLMLLSKLLKWDNFWVDRGINICVYLDDGSGNEKTVMHSCSDKWALKRIYFCCKQRDLGLHWGSTKSIKWLLVELDYEENTYIITNTTVESIRDVTEDILSSLLKNLLN